MAFLDENYLLTSKEAQDIFLYVKSLPIVDVHTHVEAEQIAIDRGWNDIWEVEGATDHYVWELMRRCGVPEEKITGDASNKEKWLAFAEVAPCLAGNPLYEWIHLDLRRRFEISELITPQTAESIWEKTKEMLASPSMRPQALLKEMKVEILCTTDSPLSDLRWHEEIRRDLSSPRILPTWRPDEFMAVGTLEWTWKNSPNTQTKAPQLFQDSLRHSKKHIGISVKEGESQATMGLRPHMESQQARTRQRRSFRRPFLEKKLQERRRGLLKPSSFTSSPS